MKTCALCLFILLCSIQANVMSAQVTRSGMRKFKLTISVGHDGAIPKDTAILIVKYTNLSDEMDYETTCGAFGAFYKLDVVHDRVSIPEPPEAAKRRKGMEKGPCSGSNPGRNLAPGQSRGDYLYYKTQKPGTYEFMVEEETDPEDPAHNVTVKSNTLTVVMGPPKP